MLFWVMWLPELKIDKDNYHEIFLTQLIKSFIFDTNYYINKIQRDFCIKYLFNKTKIQMKILLQTFSLQINLN